MDQSAMQILGSHSIMAISTLRPDGWPQTTIVGYANEGFILYFLIFRASQKFANIAADDRISIAVGHQPRDLREAQAVYAAAFAAEVLDPRERDHGWRLLVARHPALSARAIPTDTALMRAECRHVSVLDYTKGIAHTDALNLSFEGSDRAENEDER
jgi:hypothetical protein